MIQANELRIGNLLSYPDWHHGRIDKTWAVRDIYFEDNKIGLTDGQYQTITKLDYLEPIPLTEEILLKVGFVNGKDLNWGNPVIDIDGINWMGSSFDGHIFFNQIKPPCEYLHQLQNLYFALTGQELNTTGLI